MKVLVIKTSSLGDVLHTLPALTDAARVLPGIRFDWVVEEAFREVPAWHPAVDGVIPVALRRWRHRPWHVSGALEARAAIRRLRSRRYDLVIDAQGLIKSAVLSRLAKGPSCGLDRRSAREPLAALAYDRKIPVERSQHAVARVRRLFAVALDYELPDAAPDYGLDGQLTRTGAGDYLVFLHGTTWPSKHWPEAYWVELARLAAGTGWRVRLPWSNEQEFKRASRLAVRHNSIEVMPRQSLGELVDIIAGAGGVVGVDTGLVHLAAALGIPCVTLYGATDPFLTGNLGNRQEQLHTDFPCAPCLERQCRYKGPVSVQPACFEALAPEKVWASLSRMIAAPTE